MDEDTVYEMESDIKKLETRCLELLSVARGYNEELKEKSQDKQDKLNQIKEEMKGKIKLDENQPLRTIIKRK